jgi:hypothetical protein
MQHRFQLLNEFGYWKFDGSQNLHRMPDPAPEIKPRNSATPVGEAIFP